ncbi:MAG: heavy metal translocating P-type ATPase [Lysinibacillus sp.]
MTNFEQSLPFNERITQHQQLINAIISGVFIIFALMMTSKGLDTAATLTFLCAFVLGGYFKAKEGLEETLQQKKLNVELLMILAAIGSALIGFWLEGAILIFIFALSGALETYAMNKSNKELTALMSLQPEEAWLVRGGFEPLRVQANTLQLKDHVLVKPGERIPIDGVILKGETSIDEATITGESMPVNKKMGESVFAGTVNLNGSITINVTKLSKDSTVQKIIELVEDAQQQSPPAQRFIEKFEGVYVKVVLIAVALMLFLPHYLLGWDWNTTIYRAIVLLVVASPCALVASVMPATLSAISNGARNGVLVKGGTYLERLALTKVVAVDKTGTLTEGTPKVTDFVVKDEREAQSILQIVASIEAQSTHPLAQAIVQYADDQHITRINNLDIQNHAGNGLSAVVNGVHYKIGKPAYIGLEATNAFQNGLKSTLAQQGKTVIFISRDDEVIGLAAMKDTIRPEAKQAITALRKQNIYVVMLTGDNEETAKAIAEEAGVSEYIAECMPETKVQHIERFKQQYGHVAMIGDGINDAPALASATVGIAMGEGTDVALETADVVLMKNDLTKLSSGVALSQKMLRIVKQNMFFSIIVILMLIFSNFTQTINLPLGVIGHEGSTILVILNGLRLLKSI